MKHILFGCIALLIFTQGLIVYHNSSFEKGEFDSICHSIYDERVWIDTCYLPYNFEIKTFETVRNIEVVGVIISLLGLVYVRKTPRSAAWLK